jgi:molybdopterin biosynthesis enzyme
METFQKLYIQASEQIDGLTWTVVPSLSELQNLKQAKHQAAISSLANQLGKRPPERETVPGTIQVTNQTEYAVESSVKEGGSSNQPSAGQANAGAAIPEDSGQQTSDEGQNEQVRPRGEKGYVFI